MARRFATPDSQDERRSAGPSSRRNVRVKEEKHKVKEEKKVNNKGKARALSEPSVNEEDEDAEGEVDDQEVGFQGVNGEEDGEGDVQSSPRGGKRQRVNGDGDSRPSGTQRRQEEISVTLPRDVDGFIPGSIMRIQLKNFVTYDYVEFRPGPYLNMIIGPNGTGKSSIACAIALGLNFPPSILGRASDLNSFVKNGTDSGYIEIELKGPSGKANLVIRRNLSSKSKGSTFTLNKQAATGTEIKQKMIELNVQVGNLCSFLPQDKVSAFASMTPQELLRETQRAAGDPNLTRWHDTLVEAGHDLKSMHSTLKDEQESLRQMIERNEGIERDVQRFLDRKKIEQEIAILEILIPFARYRELKNEYVVIKAKQRALHQKVTRLKKKNEPAHALLREYEAGVTKASQKRDKFKKSTQDKVKAMQAKYSESDKLEIEVDNIVNRLSLLKKEEKERIKNIKTKESDIARVQEELAKPRPKPEKDEDLADEWKQINLERSAVTHKHGELRTELKDVINRKVLAKDNFETAQRGLAQLDTSDSRKLNLLRNWDNDTLDAIHWLRKNKDLFRMEVFEPPIMCVSVKNQSFAGQVESCFNSNQIRCFVAQCKEDLDTLNHNINDSEALGRRVRVNTWYRTHSPDTLLPEPMSAQEMAEIGFDGYALQYLEYPAGMEWYLKKELNLHRTAISRNANLDVNKAMTYVGRPSQFHGGGGSFITGHTFHNVTRSRYGRRALGNVTRDFRGPRNFVIPPVDMVEKQRLESVISNSKQEETLAEDQKRELQSQLDDLKKEDDAFEARMESVKKRKQAIKDEVRHIGQLRGRLTKYQADLERLQQAPSANEERTKARKKLLEISKKRISLAREYTKLARSIIAEQTENTKVSLEFYQTCANKDALKNLCSQKDEKHQKAIIEYTQAHDKFLKIKATSTAALEAMRETAQGLEPEVKARFMDIEKNRAQYDKDLKSAQEQGLPLPDLTDVELRTLEELETEMGAQQANLDMNLNTNPGVVEEYENRKRAIATLDKTIEQHKKQADRVERNIKNARDNWQPALEKLAVSIGEKFSAAFDRIGCAGEIRIGEHEDYEQWAINIYVKFRDTEKLQLLTGQRQSGGERSLTTILYLMSLTEEARAPFSLVDEINQGMDQRAERNVHNSMVEVTCKEDSAQYFLITPKLLSDLDYHKRMKILCVNNGEWLPEERDLGNMMNMIEGFVQRNSASDTA